MRLLVPPRITKTTFQGSVAWAKYPEQHQTSVFSFLHKAVSWFAPPVLRSAQTTYGEQCLAEEANRLRAFGSAGLPVPNVLDFSNGRLLLSDEGKQLRGVLRESSDPALRKRLLGDAILGLQEIHAAGFCHGRPSLKDILVNDQNAICFIDLEENPSAIMPLQDAQARDVWLLLASCAEFCVDPEGDLAQLLDLYRSRAGDIIDWHLAGLDRALKPYQRIIEVLRIRDRGRDVKAAYWAMKALNTFRNT